MTRFDATLRDAVVHHPGLPKAPIISMRWNWWWFESLVMRARRKGPLWDWRLVFFLRVRVANAALLYIGPLEMQVRRPWLEGPAKMLHPELFKEARK